MYHCFINIAIKKEKDLRENVHRIKIKPTETY